MYLTVSLKQKSITAAVGASLLMLTAGMIHLLITPDHLNHSPYHGVFFLSLGLLQLIWGLVFLGRQTLRFYQAGLIISVASIVVWLMTRTFPAPFSINPLQMEMTGMVTKTIELSAGGLLVYWGYTRSVFNQNREIINYAGTIIVFAVLIGLVIYTLGKLTEPLLPRTDHDRNAARSFNEQNDGFRFIAPGSRTKTATEL